MNDRHKKFENPVRIQELNIRETLLRIGLAENSTLCDIGAGTGIFTIPAASMTKKRVYALEISEEMMETIREKASKNGLKNIQIIKVQDEALAVENDSIDVAIMVTVFHELENKPVMLAEIKRILKDEGRLGIIEFHKRETPMGPGMDHRISKEETLAYLNEAGFQEVETYDLGDNFYCMIFKGESAEEKG